MAARHPIAIWDISWLAVPDASPGDLLTALALSDPVPLTWKQGLAAVCGNFWDVDAGLEAHLSRVFLAPPLRGWQLAIGGWFGGQKGDERLEDVARLCRSLR